MNILELRQVSKAFGPKQVLDELNLVVPTGSIFGFVGENGAGKTTTMKLILGLEQKDQGEILIKGKPVTFGDNQTNQVTGYLPDVPEFYNYMTGKEYLTFCGEITGLSRRMLQQKVAETLELVGLSLDKKRIKSYSRGMKQRLGIAQALLNDPELLICDEPTSALDPSGRNEFLEILAGLKGRTTILFSTHILSDVERICNYVGILDQGNLTISGPLEELKQQYAKDQIDIQFADKQDLRAFFKELDQLKEQEQLSDYSFDPDTFLFKVNYVGCYEKLAEEIFRSFEATQLFPRVIKKIDPSLESIFLEVVQS
ncbi:ATP-binding cassette domain-containing protein [Enterococcus sp. DIV0800]|uniref:ABC transporter ATP-binding protein n=1 Tax=unclassified Enterococcus TaxID=2608891 RepID=UPI003D2F9DBF